MRAVVVREYGPPESLVVEEVAEPEPIPTEVKVRVQVAGINPVDVKTRQGGGTAPVLGEPPVRIGWDVAGIVSEVSGGVNRFRVGDEVFGMPWFPRQAGAYAEYVTAPSRQFALKPSTLSFEEAGGLPLAGLTAWQVIVDTIGLSEGDELLIHGAAGGVGHLAVQVAKARGANVIGTARMEQAEWLHELGATRVIDYRNQRFEELVSDLDAVIDFTGANGEGSLSVLRPGGILVSVPSGVTPELVELAKRGERRAAGFMVEPDPIGLEGLATLVETGRLEVRVGQVFDLDQAAEAHRLVESGKAEGKIVLRVP
ncbi:MAG TPA: NADP-dependent oxidoreductase [Solirubrobacterales bacterium]|nr:NADP-dependent oxidoreductase [Solirubrobacterales bacterium]